jgi:hypothetical protein
MEPQVKSWAVSWTVVAVFTIIAGCGRSVTEPTPTVPGPPVVPASGPAPVSGPYRLLLTGPAAQCRTFGDVQITVDGDLTVTPPTFMFVAPHLALQLTANTDHMAGTIVSQATEVLHFLGAAGDRSYVGSDSFYLSVGSGDIPASVVGRVAPAEASGNINTKGELLGTFGGYLIQFFFVNDTFSCVGKFTWSLVAR